MNDKEKKSRLIKFYTKYENTYIQTPENIFANENLPFYDKNNGNKNKIHSNNNKKFQKRYNKEIITDNKKENKI